MRRRELLFLLIIISVAVTACSFEHLDPSIDKNKFAKLNAAALSVKTAINSGEPYKQVSDKTDILSGEIEALRPAIKTKRENRLLSAYSDLLAMYKDGLVLWKYREYYPHLQAERNGRIYVSQDVEPVVEKYRFPVERHEYKPTGQIWKTISADSINIVWKNADDQLAVIRNITNY
jgi:hypothetical protein